MCYFLFFFFAKNMSIGSFGACFLGEATAVDDDDDMSDAPHVSC